MHIQTSRIFRYADPDAEVIVKGLEVRQRTIRSLRIFSEIADELQRAGGSNEMVSSGLGIAGGLMTVGAGIVTICSAGAPAPLMASTLAFAGTGASIGGALWSIWNTIDNCKLEEELKSNIEKILREDSEAEQEQATKLPSYQATKLPTYQATKLPCYKLQSTGCRLQGMEIEEEEIRVKVERYISARKVQMVVLGFNCTVDLLGSSKAVDLLKKSTKEAAEKTSKEALKLSGMMSGGITAGLGGLGVVWDGYNLAKGYGKANTESSLGTDLRKTADFLENLLHVSVDKYQ